MPIPNSKIVIPSVIILALFFAVFLSIRASTASPDATVGAQVMVQPHVATSFTGSKTYTQNVNYENPGGGDTVRFIVAVGPDGTITKAEAHVLADPSHEISVTMQNNFAAEVGQQVVGKKLADLEVDRIGGASLTTGAFNKFLTEIQS